MVSEQRLAAELGPGHVDGQLEHGGELIVVGAPLGPADQAGHPDPVPGELGGPDRGGGGQLVGRPGEQLDGLVEGPGGRDAVGEPPRGHGEGPERRVDQAGADRGNGRVRVEQRHDLELDPGMRAVEAAQRGRRAEPAADRIDAQRALAGTHRGGGPLLGREEFAGVRREGLPVSGQLGSPCGPGEQPHAEFPLQPGHPLGDGLLSDRQVIGRFGEPARVRDGDESAHGVEVHASRP